MNNNEILTSTFTDIINEIREDYVSEVRQMMVEELERLTPITVGTRYSAYSPLERSQFRSVMKEVLCSTMDDEGNKTNRPYGPINRWNDEDGINALFDKESKYLGEMFVNAFLAKNISKFNGVVKENKIIRISHSIGLNLTGVITVECENSSFDASFSIVHKMSNRGTYFQQFPTRFHNVVLADGSSMKSPSEAKMKKIF